jgi:hypothetical protein
MFGCVHLLMSMFHWLFQCVNYDRICYHHVRLWHYFSVLCLCQTNVFPIWNHICLCNEFLMAQCNGDLLSLSKTVTSALCSINNSRTVVEFGSRTEWGTEVIPSKSGILQFALYSSSRVMCSRVEPQFRQYGQRFRNRQSVGS